MKQTQIIDFRNARYQGYLNEFGEPHGLGTYAWQHGYVEGKCIIIFGDSKIFYGRLINQTPVGVCTYHLKDKCQIFCNFEGENNNEGSIINQLQVGFSNSIPAPQKGFGSNNISSIYSPSNPRPHNNQTRLVALLPTFNMIVNVQGQNQAKLHITEQKKYRQGDIKSLQNILQNMLCYKFGPAGSDQQLQQYLSIENFIQHNFKAQYSSVLDLLYSQNAERNRQMYVCFKGTKSLGIRIQSCTEQRQLTNMHNDGNSYIVKSMGFYNTEGLIDEFGLRTIKTLIMGSIKEEVINNHGTNTSPIIVRYEQGQRPSSCIANLTTHFKKSTNFANYFIATKYLLNLQGHCLNINFNIKQTQTKKHAQLVLQNPKKLTKQEQRKIEEGRKRHISKDRKSQSQIQIQSYQINSSKQRILDYQRRNQSIQKAKEDIYRSLSKKKLNTQAQSPSNGKLKPTSNNPDHIIPCPQKDVKPAELTNIKPREKIYQNTPEKAFFRAMIQQAGKNSQGDVYDPQNGYIYDHMNSQSDDKYKKVDTNKINKSYDIATNVVATNTAPKPTDITTINKRANQSFKYSEKVENKYFNADSVERAKRQRLLQNRQADIKGQTSQVARPRRLPRQYNYLDADDNPIDIKYEPRSSANYPNPNNFNRSASSFLQRGSPKNTINDDVAVSQFQQHNVQPSVYDPYNHFSSHENSAAKRFSPSSAVMRQRSRSPNNVDNKLTLMEIASKRSRSRSPGQSGGIALIRERSKAKKNISNEIYGSGSCQGSGMNDGLNHGDNNTLVDEGPYQKSKYNRYPPPCPPSSSTKDTRKKLPSPFKRNQSERKIPFQHNAYQQQQGYSQDGQNSEIYVPPFNLNRTQTERSIIYRDQELELDRQSDKKVSFYKQGTGPYAGQRNHQIIAPTSPIMMRPSSNKVDSEKFMQKINLLQEHREGRRPDSSKQGKGTRQRTLSSSDHQSGSIKYVKPHQKKTLFKNSNPNDFKLF